MSKLVKRLLTFFIGLPVMIALVIFDYFHHLPLNIVAVGFSFIGAWEFCNMATKKTPLFNKYLISTLAALLPLITYFFSFFEIGTEAIAWIFTFFIIILMAVECFSQENFTFSVEKLAISTLIIFYCGFGMTFISRMTMLTNSTYFIILYFILVFMCDSGAWFFGMLFGKSTRGFVKASPNKSLVGFIGGIITSIACGVILKTIFPEIFTGSYVKIIILGLFTSVAAVIGDLIESVFKRSCDVKDSGNLIPGRGGALDCLDSLLAAAPVFYIGTFFLYLV